MARKGERFERSLLRAMEVVLRVGRADVISSRHYPWAAGPCTRKGPRPERLYIPGQHRHFTSEICLGLHGSAMMAVADRLYLLKTPAVAILEPEVRHSEGIWEAAQAYELLWVIPELSGQCKIQLSRYSPDSGWAYPLHFNFQSSCLEALLGRFAKHAPDLAPGGLETVRAELLAVLGEALAEILRRPKDPPPASAGQDETHPLVEQVKNYLEANLRHHVTLERLAQMSKVTPDYLNRLFRRQAGEPIHAYLLKKRLEAARRMCEQSDLLIKQIALGVGFNDPLYFSRLFRKHHGCSPTDLRHGFQGRSRDANRPPGQ